MLFPLEAILRMADLEAVQMQLAEQALVREAVRRSEDVGGSIRLVSAPFDQPVASEECEASLRGAAPLTKSRESEYSLPITKIEVDSLSPLTRLCLRLAVERRDEHRGFVKAQ